MRPTRKRLFEDREAGLTIVEVTFALGIFAILILSVSFTLISGIQHRRETFQSYQAMSAVRDMIAEIQQTANEPQDLTRSLGIGAVYSLFNAKTYPLTSTVQSLTTGDVSVTLYPNESAVPSALGGTQDLNYDGDKADNLGNASAGTDLKIVPAALTVTYTMGNTTRTMTIHRLITKTTN